MSFRKFTAFCFLGALLGTAETYAGGTQLLQPVGPSVVFIDGTNPLGQALGVAGYCNGSAPPWVIAQWNIQQNLQPVCGSGTGWTIANQYARVEYYPQIDGGQNVYELAQASGICNERDLFIATGDPSISGASTGYRTSSFLTYIGSLRVDVGLNAAYDLVNHSCALNYSQYVYSIILISTTGQVLYYQINLGRSVDSGQSPNVSWCPSYESSNDQQFCLDDDIRNLGGTWVSPFHNVVNSVEFLPRILQVISAGHVKASGVALDSDPSHWYTQKVYAGDVIQGDAVSTTRWYGLGLREWAGGTFCGGGQETQWVCGQGQPDGSGWVDVGSGCFHRYSGLSC